MSEEEIREYDSDNSYLQYMSDSDNDIEENIPIL